MVRCKSLIVNIIFYRIPGLNLSSWVCKEKMEYEASNPCAYERFEWGSDGYAGKLNTMDYLEPPKVNPVSASESHIKASD
jgi:hypothetical protein